MGLVLLRVAWFLGLHSFLSFSHTFGLGFFKPVFTRHPSLTRERTDNNTTMTTSTSSTDTSSSPSSSSTRTSKQTVETLTSTAPNGAVVVVTATTYVSPDSPETPAPSSTNRATLQNAAAGRYQGFGGSALAAAIGLAVLLVAV